MRTQVGIVGGGPAGLLLAPPAPGGDRIRRARTPQPRRPGDDGQGRRARTRHGRTARGVGVGERMEQEGSVHHGIELRFDGRGHRIDFADLTDGLSITIYGQQEVVKDLIRARLEADGKILFEARRRKRRRPDTDSPKIRFFRMASKRRSPATTSPAATALSGSAGAGSRGCAHGVHQNLSLWVVRHPRRGTAIDGGVDLHPPRPRLRPGQHPLPEVQRLYFQCDPQDDVGEWPDERIWDELSTRLATHDGWELAGGEIFQKDIVQMRSFVCEPMQHGRLFLAGDAAHIVPPTGAKGEPGRRRYPGPRPRPDGVLQIRR